jgi:hypothetical protein
MEEHNEQEIIGIDADQIEEFLNGSDIDKLPPIEIGLGDYDVEEFTRGIEETSYVAGKITALFNAGMSEASILDYLLTTETIKHNYETAKINKEMNIEIAKNQKLVMDKNEL